MNHKSSKWKRGLVSLMASHAVLSASLFLQGPVFAQDKRGSGVREIKTDGGVGGEILYRNSYALLIGNDKYENPSWSNLPGVEEDIPAVRQALQAQGFKVEEVWDLPRNELLARIDEFISDYGQDYENRLLIYYAGHGYTALLSDKRKMGYLVMKNAPEMPPVEEALQKTPATLPKFRLRAISMDEINEKAQAIATRHALFVFDSCFSGTVLYRDNIVAAPKEITPEELEQMRGYLTAGNERQRVLDRSPFRRAFVKGLAGAADLNSDGFILFTELGLYLRSEVARETENRQTPIFGKSDGFKRGEMVFILPKGAASLPNLLKTLANAPARIKSEDPPAKASPVMDIVTAQSILDRASQARDGSMQGQVEALESLLARGHEFSSTNLSGISFRRAKIPKGIFNRVRMHAVDLSEADARGANFADSGLRFANLEHALFGGTILTNSYAPFVWGKDVSFEGANLSDANFFSSDFRGANFSNAKLRGTVFAYADLRGAKFDGADLTGAYFTGAVLDNATFVNATIDNTDFNGAVADKFLLSQKQKTGACRHSFDEGWTFSVYEMGKNDSFTYRLLNFPVFADKTLPVCTTPTAEYTIDPIQNAIFIDQVALSKADRRNIFLKRLDEHGKFLKENLTVNRILKGDNAQRKSWDAYLRSAVKKTTPVSKPYVNKDLMLMVLLRAGIVGEETLDWEEMAKSLYKYEASVREDYEGNFNAYSMWSPIFPPGVMWGDLPDDKVELYKIWTLARVAKVPDQVIIKVPISLAEVKNKDGGPLTVTLDTMGFARRGDYYHNIEQKRIDVHQTLYVSGDFANAERSRTIEALFVLPRPLSVFRIELPGKFKNEKNLELEMDVKIEKVDSFGSPATISRKASLSAFIFVKPGNVRLLKEGKLVWTGDLQMAP